MARSARHAHLETRTARARLAVRRSPYFVKVAKGLRLGYYRGGASGTWIGRLYRGAGVYATTAIGLADDTLEANGHTAFDYWQAQDAVRRWGEHKTLAHAGIVDPGPYTVADAVRNYLAAARAEKKPEAVRSVEYTFNAFILPDLGHQKLEELTAEGLTAWRNKLSLQPRRVRTRTTAKAQATISIGNDDDDARRKRKATANRILSMLKAVLNRAFQHGWTASDHAWRRVKPFRRVDEAVVRYLTPDEARRLVNACEPQFRKLVQAALLTGCRYSELTRLRAVDLNADSGTLAIRLSKGKLRHVTLTDEALALFRTWASGEGKALMLPRADGRPWKKSEQQRPLAAGSKIANITPPVTFHILRHTHGSHLAMRGTPMAIIAKQLGHADTRITEKHYAHLAPSYVAATIRANFPSLGIGDTLSAD